MTAISSAGAQALGRVSRRYRYAGGPLGMLGRICGRGVRNLVRAVPDDELAFVDIDGYARVADIRDDIELDGFLGIGRLPEWTRALVGPGDWVVDVGANVGLITAQMCRLVGSAGRVWAIEPIPRNLQRLQELAQQNRLRQLQVIDGALSNVTGYASIRLPVGHQRGWASFTKSWDTAGTLTTATWRLDELVAGQPGRIAFLKIDVEGFEPQVLAGATDALRSMRPRVLCEFNDILLRDAGTSSADLLDLFAELGYRPNPASEKQSTRLDGQVLDLLLEFAE